MFNGKENVKYGRIILADSHPEMLEGVRGLLETTFEAVVIVADMHSLITSAGKLGVDLVVADLSLPGSNGFNLVREFKNYFPDLKLIVLSIHDEPTVLKEVLVAGADGFVLKRSAATDLIPAVEAVAAGKIYVSPASRERKGFDRPGSLGSERDGK